MKADIVQQEKKNMAGDTMVIRQISCVLHGVEQGGLGILIFQMIQRNIRTNKKFLSCCWRKSLAAGVGFTLRDAERWKQNNSASHHRRQRWEVPCCWNYSEETKKRKYVLKTVS